MPENSGKNQGKFKFPGVFPYGKVRNFPSSIGKKKEEKKYYSDFRGNFRQAVRKVGNFPEVNSGKKFTSGGISKYNWKNSEKTSLLFGKHSDFSDLWKIILTHSSNFGTFLHELFRVSENSRQYNQLTYGAR